MVRVAVLINELSSTSIPLEIAVKVHRTTNVEVLIISYFDMPGDDIDPDIEELQLPVLRLGADSRIDLSALSRIREVCKNDDVSILHTHHNSTGSLARLAIFGTGTQVVNTEHNDHRFFTTLQKTANSATYKIIDYNVSNSQSTKDSFAWYERLLLNGLLNGVEQRVIYNGIDKERIDSASRPSVDLPDGPNITIVGSITEQKNHETALRAFKTVNDTVPESSLIVVGGGALSENLQNTSTKLGLQNDVLFTGYLPRRDDVYGVLKKSEIAVFPSWYEGFCVAAVEAMAAGLPVVVSDIDVFHEVVGDPGVFADPNDPEAFADEIIDLLQHPKKRELLGQEAKERARSEFSLERTAREYSNLYKEVAERANR
ncbi:glycosyltransferase family 4 protein [Halorhabdus tiamatea]|uniref:glycosyltransferase family 4 protein n=1 Tax=Halorhabdus tiamatea TaxID=430914 RepID=UPI0009AC5481|nr:glycosyltransferase family 4 protein [Halorhabdus tiamatea]